MNKITKAVFPVAGLGTRFLPATKAMPKELLPIIDKPIIQYAVEEAVAAGITDLVFVTGRTKRAIEDHFDANPELERELRDKGKDDVADMISEIVPSGVNCIFIRQHRALGLGHAVLCAESVVGPEPFMVLLADDVVRGGVSPTQALVEAYEKSGKSQLSVMTVPQEEASKYGMVVPGEDAGSVAGLIEKPEPEDAPSLQASIGRYALEPEIFALLRDQAPGAGGEIQLADAINRLAQAGRVECVPLQGSRYDCGSKFGYLEAIVNFALDNLEFRDRFGAMLAERLVKG
ncbi:UDP-glucose pyrophosphorylase [Thalassovita litoralis]|uniref:UTP--glucose-1-phosphate uridylyltransferase n=1 Tax=Thalassovita litoralis TaxID=1010611 RepID=A0A521ECM1_9RHOB|nr:UTP--glucose-1-phosphate uridylyltransferase GalU [Thalassovita litoralis]SMO80930.1 UDP-glucose pyrophosphorylase [Thalassovita litoralis]